MGLARLAPKGLFIIRRAVKVQVESRVVEFAKGNVEGGEEFHQMGGRGRREVEEGGLGQEHGVARAGGARGLTDLGRVSGAEADQGLQCSLAEVGLVAEGNGEVSQERSARPAIGRRIGSN